METHGRERERGLGGVYSPSLFGHHSRGPLADSGRPLPRSPLSLYGHPLDSALHCAQQCIIPLTLPVQPRGKNRLQGKDVFFIIIIIVFTVVLTLLLHYTTCPAWTSRSVERDRRAPTPWPCSLKRGRNSSLLLRRMFGARRQRDGAGFLWKHLLRLWDGSSLWSIFLYMSGYPEWNIRFIFKQHLCLCQFCSWIIRLFSQGNSATQTSN